MKTNAEMNLENLKKLIADCGGLKQFSKKINKSDSQVSQWTSQSKNSKTHKPRNIGAESCRLIESVFELEVGWMDHDHSAARPWPFKLVAREVFDKLPDSEKIAIDESMLARCKDQKIVPRSPTPTSDAPSPKTAA